jgi:ketosteroid isomerase-like protein
MAEGPNSALVREAIDAFNRHDVEAVLARVTDDVEWQRVDGLPDGGGVIRGRDAVRALMEPNAFERMTVEPLEIVEKDEVALVRTRVNARGAASGVELEIEAFVVYRFENGLARRVENHSTREDAERSAGLRFG